MTTNTIAEGKVKPTISDLDRLIRLEEDLRGHRDSDRAEARLLDELRRRYANRRKREGGA